MNRVRKNILAFLILSAFTIGCAKPVEHLQANDRIIVSVSVLPEKYFVERIGGDHVQVNVMVGPGESPHSYEPKASQMIALSDSLLYFRIGVEFENVWMEKIRSANPSMEIIDVSAGIEKISINTHEHGGEAHNDDEVLNEQILDPHIWTSPQNGKIIAESIAAALIHMDPQNSENYQSNLDSLLKDITALQSSITTLLDEMENRNFLVFHPAWGYFAREFDLIQIPVEIGGNEPSARELSDLISRAKEENIHIVFAQPEFNTRSADTIASEINGKVILISPLAEDWLGNLQTVADTFSEEL